MISLKCDYCESELTESGAVILSPSDEDGKVNKYHACTQCSGRLLPPSFFHARRIFQVTLAPSDMIEDSVRVDFDASEEVFQFNLSEWQKLDAAVKKILVDGKKKAVVKFK